MNRSIVFESYGMLAGPTKAVWSPAHGKLIVAGEKIVYAFDPASESVEAFHHLSDRIIVDMDVSDDGKILLLYARDDNGSPGAKVISPNLFDIVDRLDMGESENPRNCVFAHTGKCLVAAEIPGGTNASSQSKFYLFGDGEAAEWELTTKGLSVAMATEKDNGHCVSVTSGGDVVVLPASSSEAPEVVGNVGDGVSAACWGPKSLVDISGAASKVRIFVGSSPWASDRWDSGELEASASSVLYGGGDNLMPGYSYWAHVSAFHEGSGWSRPQIQRFTVPKSE